MGFFDVYGPSPVDLDTSWRIELDLGEVLSKGETRLIGITSKREVLLREESQDINQPAAHARLELEMFNPRSLCLSPEVWQELYRQGRLYYLGKVASCSISAELFNFEDVLKLHPRVLANTAEGSENPLLAGKRPSNSGSLVKSAQVEGEASAILGQNDLLPVDYLDSLNTVVKPPLDSTASYGAAEITHSRCKEVNSLKCKEADQVDTKALAQSNFKLQKPVSPSVSESGDEQRSVLASRALAESSAQNVKREQSSEGKEKTVPIFALDLGEEFADFKVDLNVTSEGSVRRTRLETSLTEQLFDKLKLIAQVRKSVLHPLRDLTPFLSPSQATLVLHAAGLACWHRKTLFCAECGTRLQVGGAGWEVQCPVCKRIEYPRQDPSIIVSVIDADQRILLAHNRMWTNRPRFVSLIAGYVETGESVEHAVYREVKEETGLELTKISYLGSQPWPFPRSLMLGFTAQTNSNTLQLNPEELTWGGWFSREEFLAQLAAKKIFAPNPSTIAYRIISHWLGQPIPLAD